MRSAGDWRWQRGGYSAQVSQHLLGTSERLLGVHHPLGFAQWLQVLGERIAVGEPSMIAEELQAGRRAWAASAW